MVRLVKIGLQKSLDMFKFTKSETDLGKLAEPIQYKVLCDWLRNIHQQNIQLARKITILTNLLNDQSSSPSGEPVVHPDDDNQSDTESVY